jgi:hypothetical protein
MTIPIGSRPRSAFTVLETVAALSILLMVMLIVAQLGTWALQERLRNGVRHQAIEYAANVLESARALPFESVTEDWASEQELPQSLTVRLHDAKLSVHVGAEPSRPNTKRVSVEIVSSLSRTVPEPPVRLTALISARSLAAQGGKP